MNEKVPWQGVIRGVQPRIRLIRSFDESQHSYLGYLLRIDGTIGTEQRSFEIGIGKGTQEKHEFRRGDLVRGQSVEAPKRAVETAEYYKTSGLKVLSRPGERNPDPPPWFGAPPTLPTYRERGHRRLSTRIFAAKCESCIWGCRMAVDMIIDHWNPTKRRQRVETFCYGPKSCPIYKAGPTPKVPGRNGMSWEEPDWVDEQNTEHRGPDD